MGLPRLLPSAVRFQPAALPAAALPHAPHPDRCRAADGDRRKRPARGRLRSALRRDGGCVERDRPDLWTCSRPRFGGAAVGVSGLGDDLSPGLERRGVRHRPVALGARARADASSPQHSGVRRAGRRHRDPRPHPAREPGAAPGRARAPHRGRRVAPASDVGRRLSRRCSPAARGVGRAQRDPLRRHDRRAGWTGLGPVPSRLAGRQDHRAGERPCVEAARRSDRAPCPDRGAVRLAPCPSRCLSGQRIELRDGAAHRALRPLPRARQQLRDDLRLRHRGDSSASENVRARRGRCVLAVPHAGADP